MGTNNQEQYYGFWIRVVAAVVDSIIISLISFGISYLLMTSSLSMLKLMIIGFVFYFLIGIFYDGFFVKKYGATPGKMLVRAQIVKEDGSEMTWGTAIGRHFASYISLMLLGIGFFMIGWDERKQGIHDKIVKTLVIENENSKVPNSVKTTMIVLTIIIIIGYIGYMGFQMGAGFFAGLASAKTIDQQNPIASLKEICNHRFERFQDECIITQLEDDKIPVKNYLEGCELISSNEVHSKCLLSYSILNQENSACQSARTKYYVNECEKTYELTFKIVEKLEIGKANSELKGGYAETVIYRGNEAIMPESNTFSPDDQFCFMINNVSGFKTGTDGLSKYSMGYKIRDEDNKLLAFYRVDDLFEKSAVFENGILKRDGFCMNEGEFLGNLNYEIIIVDDLSKDQISFNQTITIKNISWGKLTLNGYDVGVYENDDCSFQKSNIYSQKDSICVVPMVTSGFVSGSDKLHWFDMDMRIFNSENLPVYAYNGVFGDDGHIYLSQGILRDRYVFYDMSKYPAGDYTLKLRIYDLVGKKEVWIEKKVTTN